MRAFSQHRARHCTVIGALAVLIIIFIVSQYAKDQNIPYRRGPLPVIRTVAPLKQASTDRVTEVGSTGGSSCVVQSGLPTKEAPLGDLDGDSWLSELLSSVGCTNDDTDTIVPRPVGRD